MKGKKKEPKILLGNSEISPVEIIDAVKRNTWQVEEPQSYFYRDIYYDTPDEFLLKQGGSLKVRIGRKGAFSRTDFSVIMRMKTKYPSKDKASNWDELEVSTFNSKEFDKTISPVRPFFEDVFDFSKLKQEPVLICTTSRKAFCISDAKYDKFYFLFDTVTYESDEKEYTEYLLKIRSRNEEFNKKVISKIFEELTEKFKEFSLINASRYERALECLSKIS